MSTAARLKRGMPQRYRLEAGKCAACGYIAFPPRVICPECESREFEQTRLAESGKVATFTVIRVAPDNFTDEAPYAMAIVDLDGGSRIMCQVVDCDLDKVAIGMNVRIEFRLIQSEGEAGLLYYGYKAVPA